MNRSERRQQVRKVKRILKAAQKVPLLSNHGTYTQQEIDSFKSNIKNHIATYSFSSKYYEEVHRQMSDVSGLIQPDMMIIRLGTFPVKQIVDNEILYTDIFLNRHGGDWYLSYTNPNMNFQQNLVIAVSELGFQHMASTQNMCSKVFGFMIPQMNHIIRHAFESLTSKYGDAWVA